jgi:hypothetical protein
MHSSHHAGLGGRCSVYDAFPAGYSHTAHAPGEWAINRGSTVDPVYAPGEWAPSAASVDSSIGEWAPSAASAGSVLDPYIA